MKVERLFQPIGGQSGVLLSSSFDRLKGPTSKFLLVSAWIKLTGLSRLWNEMMAFREAGGEIVAVVGIDQMGTTREALARLVEIATEAYVFRDASRMGRSFHPKFYAVRDEGAAIVVSGSGNFTRGGLFTNYEAFDVFTLDLTLEADRDFIATIDAESAELLSDPSTVTRLDEEVVTKWTAASLLPSEVSAPRTTGGISNSNGVQFGSRTGLPGAPPPQLPLPEAVEKSTEETESVKSGPEAPPTASAANGLKRAIFETSRGRPGQLQLRGDVFEWVVGSRTSLIVVSDTGVRHTSPVVATRARGGVNTRRLELPGIDQNGSDRFLLLEQETDNAIRYKALIQGDPRLSGRPPSKPHPKPFCLQEVIDGKWTTVRVG